MSACAGTTAAVVTYPMDFLRTRLTVDRSALAYMRFMALAGSYLLQRTLMVPNRRFGHYRGAVNAIRSIYRHEGFLGFYKGVTAAILVSIHGPLGAVGLFLVL